MGRFEKGEVVALFPFSDLSRSKRRPAVVVAALTGDDVLWRQITSRAIPDTYAIAVGVDDVADGGLHQPYRHSGLVLLRE
jgi:mRNA interferase MazF